MNDYYYQAFLAQDYKTYNFDAIFYVDGEELYAHRDVLASVSSVFKEIFIKNRPTPDDPINRPIQIDGYSYDEFFEFFQFIYFPSHDDIDPDLLYGIIQLAHIYNIDYIKEEVGSSLANTCGYGDELDNDDIKDFFEKIEFAHKYSLKSFKEDFTVVKCIDEYFETLIEFDGFINLDKSVIEAFVWCTANQCYDEGLCKALYKWGKYQAMITVEMPKEEKNQLILHQIKEFLPFLNFQEMGPKCLFKFAVPKGLISIEEANKYGRIEVTVESKGISITGTFVDTYGIYEYIESYEYKKLIDRGSNQRCFWNEKFKQPSTPSTVEKMKGCDWYLAFDINGKLNLKHYTLIKVTDYLIAEMKSEEENGAIFILEKNHKVYATVSRMN